MTRRLEEWKIGQRNRSEESVRKVVKEKVQKVVIEVVKEQKRSLNLSRQIRVSQGNS